MTNNRGPMQATEPDPRPFKIYRNKKGWPTWYQRFFEAYWVLTRKHTLHSAWQAGVFHGGKKEYERVIINGGR